MYWHISRKPLRKLLVCESITGIRNMFHHIHTVIEIRNDDKNKYFWQKYVFFVCVSCRWLDDLASACFMVYGTTVCLCGEKFLFGYYILFVVVVVEEFVYVEIKTLTRMSVTKLLQVNITLIDFNLLRVSVHKSVQFSSLFYKMIKKIFNYEK